MLFLERPVGGPGGTNHILDTPSLTRRNHVYSNFCQDRFSPPAYNKHMTAPRRSFSKEEAAMSLSTTRILDEGYGPGAWHGNDFKAAIADVSPTLAFWRPAAGRHNIAEIALHHAYVIHAVRGKLSEMKIEPFVLQGEDWFVVDDASSLQWPLIQKTVAEEQRQLAAAAENSQDLELILGVTCHANYHAGQVQLIKALAG
jgi:hypothetical protein